MTMFHAYFSLQIITQLMGWSVIHTVHRYAAIQTVYFLILENDFQPFQVSASLSGLGIGTHVRFRLT